MVRTIVVTTLCALLLITLSNGCSSGSGTSPPASSCNDAPITITAPKSVDSLYGNEGLACGWGTDGVVFGMAASGASCSSPNDCSPSCCACPNAAYHSIATWCNSGVCASPEETCCMILGSHVCGNGG